MDGQLQLLTSLNDKPFVLSDDWTSFHKSRVLIIFNDFSLEFAFCMIIEVELQREKNVHQLSPSPGKLYTVTSSLNK